VEAINVIKGQRSPRRSTIARFTSECIRLVDSTGASVPVRWDLTPMQPFEAASTASSVQAKNYLFDALIAQIHRQPLRWQLILVIGNPAIPLTTPRSRGQRDGERVDVEP